MVMTELNNYWVNKNTKNYCINGLLLRLDIGYMLQDILVALSSLSYSE